MSERPTMSSHYNIPSSAPGAPAAHAADHGEHAHHIPSARFLTFVLAVLLAMTALTVYTALDVNLGQTGNLVVALAIAGFKAALVVGFFMHLHWDNRFNAVILLYCLIAVFTFLVFTMLDLGSRDAVDPTRAVMIEPEIVRRATDAAIAAGDAHNPEAEQRAEDFEATLEHGDPHQSPTIQTQPATTPDQRDDH